LTKDEKKLKSKIKRRRLISMVNKSEFDVYMADNKALKELEKHSHLKATMRLQLMKLYSE